MERKHFMEKMKQFLIKAVNPGTGVVISGIPITVALMIYVFGFGHEGEPVSYIAYVVSAYAATILCVWAAKGGKKAALSAERFLRRNRYADRYLSDLAFKSLVSLYLSVVSNILYAFFKLGMGIFYHSVWLITLAVYYGFLISMRLLLLRHITVDRLGKDLLMEFKRYRYCAVILLLMNAALIGMVVLVIHQNEGFQYSGMLIYIVALYDFCIIITAVVNLFRVRKHGSPILSASRVVNFAAALIAMLSLETAMLAEFDTTGDMVLRNIMVAATGGGVSVIFIAMAAYMLARSGKEINKMMMRKEIRDDTYSGGR